MLLLAADLSASESARRVYLIAGGLVVLGLALLALTVWFWRTSRPEHPSLGPLEVMSDRRWTRLDEQGRRRRVEAARAAAVGLVSRPPEIDLDALSRQAPAGFDDLREGVPSPPTVEDDDTLAAPVPPPFGAIDPLMAQVALDTPVVADDPVGERDDRPHGGSGIVVHPIAPDPVVDRG